MLSFIEKLIAKAALALAGDKVKKALIVLVGVAAVYVGQYPATQLAHYIVLYVFPFAAALGIASGGTSALQPPTVSAALVALSSEPPAAQLTPAPVPSEPVEAVAQASEPYDPYKV